MKGPDVECGLFDEVALPCKRIVPNRIALAPLTNLQSATNGVLEDAEFEWLTRRAEGGFGWVSTCAAFVSEQGHAWDGQLGISDDAHLEGLTRLAGALRRHGAFSVVQLHHGGVQAKRSEDPISTGGPEGARAATLEDLEGVVRDFVSAARRAEAAGFDGVEIHGANGYLFTQFLAPHDNPRSDDFGGSLENRARLIRQTFQAVRGAVSEGFAVGVRLSPVDTWTRRGLELADGIQVGRWLAEDGADFLHLSLRDAGGPAPFEPASGSVVAAFRRSIPDAVPILSAGGVWNRAEAEGVIRAGASVVALGRVGIGNPDWPRQITRSGWEPARPPWSRQHLASVKVGPSFQTYLERFDGLVATDGTDSKRTQ